MLTFIVPVKSKLLTSDWLACSKLFERTLKSICNQINDNFKVIVVCHELPQVIFTSDKIEYVQVPFDPPTLVADDWNKNRELKEGDKANKILIGFERAKKYKPDYIMVVDADDCISNAIVSFVAQQENNMPGWYIDKGYYYKEGANYLFLNKKTFNNLCGSCIIIRTDLFLQLITQDPCLYYFHELKELPNGIALEPLPFAGALYSMGNGENHYMSAQQAVKLIKNKESKAVRWEFLRSLYRKLLKYRVRPITKKFKQNFNFYNV